MHLLSVRILWMMFMKILLIKIKILREEKRRKKREEKF